MGRTRPRAAARLRRSARRGPGNRAVRVTHLGKFYPPVPGGMERVLQALCEGERERGVDSRALVVGAARATVTDTINGGRAPGRGRRFRTGRAWCRRGLIRRAPRLTSGTG